MNYYGYTVYPNGDILGKQRTILKHKISKKGYHYIKICRKGKSKNMYVHRLLAICYLSNPEIKPTVHHIDDNTNNNDLTNLMWATMKEQSDAKTKIRNMYNNNTSGYIGVYNYKNTNIWRASLIVKGKNHYRICKTKELAIIARNELEELYLT